MKRLIVVSVVAYAAIVKLSAMPTTDRFSAQSVQLVASSALMDPPIPKPHMDPPIPKPHMDPPIPKPHLS